MQGRRFLSRLGWWLGGAAAALVVLELALRLLPVSTGLPRTADFARWPLQNADPHTPYSYSITWAMLNAHRGVTNNYGHVAPFDFRKDSGPIVVIGDSYIESLMNRYDDTLQGQLARRGGVGAPVYGLGVSGLSASDYAALAGQARDELKPVAAVFAITDGDLSESLLPSAGSHHLVAGPQGLRLQYTPIVPNPTTRAFRRSVGNISLHRYFQVNLQFSVDALLAKLRPAAPAAAPQPGPDPAPRVNAQREVVDWFLADLPGRLNLPPRCIVLLLDTDRYAIYKPSLASARKDDPQVRAYLVERAQALGYRVSDLEPVFRRRYAEQRLRFDYWPVDRHWNALGHGIAADEAYRLLYRAEPAGGGACLATVAPN